MIKNKSTFEEASSISLAQNTHPVGIGEYQEKSIHAVLKYYFEPNKANQEIKIGSFYADILNEYGIIEIQTRNFNAMREKLAYFLENYEVTIVYPLIHNKYINWVNSENDKDYMKKSPRHDNIFVAFKELYKIKSFLTHPHLHFHFVFCDVIELKNLDGWNKTKKKGSSSINKIPMKIDSEVDINAMSDFLKYINPTLLEKEFSVADFKKENKCDEKATYNTLNCLCYAGILEIVRKEKRKNIYKIK